jgi:hypothetical protein
MHYIKRSHKFFASAPKRVKREVSEFNDTSLNCIFSFLPSEDIVSIQQTCKQWRSIAKESCSYLQAALLCHTNTVLSQLSDSNESIAMLKELQGLLTNRVSHLRNEVFLKQCIDRCSSTNYQILEAECSDVYLYSEIIDEHSIQKYQRQDYYLKIKNIDEIYSLLIRKNKYLWEETDGRMVSDGTTSLLSSNSDPYNWKFIVEITDEDGKEVWDTHTDPDIIQLGRDFLNFISDCFQLVLSKEHFQFFINNGIERKQMIPFWNKFEYKFFSNLFNEKEEYYEYSYDLSETQNTIEPLPLDNASSWSIPNDVIPNIISFLPLNNQYNFSSVNKEIRHLYENNIMNETLLIASKFAQKTFGVIESSQSQLQIFSAMLKVIEIRVKNMIQDVFESECISRFNELLSQDTLPFLIEPNQMTLSAAEIKPLHKKWNDVGENYFAAITQVERRSVVLEYYGNTFVVALAQKARIWNEQGGVFLSTNFTEVTDPSLIVYLDDPDEWKMEVTIHKYNNMSAEEERQITASDLLSRLTYIAMKASGYNDGHFKRAFRRTVESDGECPKWMKHILDTCEIPVNFDRQFHYSFYDY